MPKGMTAAQIGFRKGRNVKSPYGPGVVRRIKNGEYIQYVYVYVPGHNREYACVVDELELV